MRAIARAALDKKGEEIALLDVEGKASYCDWFILVNGTNNRHVAAIAEGIVEALKKMGHTPLGVEGLETGRWVLLDYGSGLVHIFLEPLRGYYDLDGLWMDATRVAVEAKPSDGPAYQTAHASS